MKNNFLKKLCLSAMMVALSTALSMVKIFTMPLGGTVTPFSMLPVCLIPFLFGTGWGLATAFTYAAGQLFLSLPEVLSWGLTPAALVGTILLDYLLAFTVLGFSGVFAKKGMAGMIGGIVFALALRFLFHFISGMIIFDIWCDWNNLPLYSLCYNGAYMLPEMILTVTGALLLSKANVLDKIKKVTA